MKLDDAFEGMGHTVRKGFKAKRAFGEPIKVGDGVTIIPVAKVMMAGGAGGGIEEAAGEEKEGGKGPVMGSGGGFGFKGGVKPIGYIKIKDGHARFVRIHEWDKIAIGLIALTGILAMTVKKEMMMLEWLKWKMLKRKMMHHKGMHGHMHSHGMMHHKGMHKGMQKGMHGKGCECHKCNRKHGGVDHKGGMMFPMMAMKHHKEHEEKQKANKKAENKTENKTEKKANKKAENKSEKKAEKKAS